MDYYMATPIPEVDICYNTFHGILLIKWLVKPLNFTALCLLNSIIYLCIACIVNLMVFRVVDRSNSGRGARDKNIWLYSRWSEDLHACSWG